MSITRIYAVVLRQFYLLSATLTRVIQLSWAAVEVVIWGFLSVYLTDVGGSELGLSLLGAVLLWEFLIRVMYGVSSAFLEDVWSRNFLNLFGSPLTVSEYLIGLIVTSVFTTVISFGLVMGVGFLGFGFSLLAFGAALLPSLLILFFFGIALGIFGVAIVLRFGPAAEWLIWPLPAVISPFAGVFYPLATLPSWMQAIAHAFPPAYVFESARSVIFSGTLSPADLATGALLSCAYVVAAYLFFARVYRRAIRTGLIARYSAESTF